MVHNNVQYAINQFAYISNELLGLWARMIVHKAKRMYVDWTLLLPLVFANLLQLSLLQPCAMRSFQYSLPTIRMAYLIKRSPQLFQDHSSNGFLDYKDSVVFQLSELRNGIKGGTKGSRNTRWNKKEMGRWPQRDLTRSSLLASLIFAEALGLLGESESLLICIGKEKSRAVIWEMKSEPNIWVMYVLNLMRKCMDRARRTWNQHLWVILGERMKARE